MDEYELIMDTNMAPTLPMIIQSPIVLIPTDLPDSSDLAPVHAAVSMSTALMIIVFVAIIVFACYKRYKYRSSLMRVCFPLYPISRVLRGSYKSDIFVEVCRVSDGEIFWAHFKSVGAHPTQLTQTGKLNASKLSIQKFCCFRRLKVQDWNDVTITNIYGKVIQLPKKGSISIWTPNKIKSITPDEPYVIRILGRVLDQIMELPEPNEMDLRQEPTAPLASADDLAISYKPKTQTVQFRK